jgi:predicted nucleotide-binding protein
MTEESKAERTTARPFPAFGLQESLAAARAIQDKNAGKPMNRLLLADAIGIKAGSSRYRELLSSSYKYGLTEGTEKATQVSLTSLGERITKPLNEPERVKALREAVLKPDAIRQVFEHYDQARLPSGEFFRNALEREFGISRAHAEEFEERIVKDGRFVGVIQDISGAPHVMIETEFVPPPDQTQPSLEATTPLVQPPRALAPPSPTPKQLFVGHGRNKVPLEQLKGILNGFKVPHKVAVDEPNSGRPISEKVAQTMKECTSGIFIFTGDEEVYDKGGNPVWRPSGNVIYELGAASMLYGKNIVIFKEDGVDFPTDFRDIGYIPFEKNKLDAKASDLFKELIQFGILKVSVA